MNHTEIMKRIKETTEIMKRIKEICDEFDARAEQVGIAIARLELAKALAESEANQQSKTSIKENNQ